MGKLAVDELHKSVPLTELTIPDLTQCQAHRHPSDAWLHLAQPLDTLAKSFMICHDVPR